MKNPELFLANILFRLSLLTAFASVASLSHAAEDAPRKYQYSFQDIQVVPASAEEVLLDHFSVKKADEYLLAGATAWTKQKKCISCHAIAQ